MKEFTANKVLFTPSAQPDRRIVVFFSKKEVIAFPVSYDQGKKLLDWLNSNSIEAYTIEGSCNGVMYSVQLVRDALHSLKYAELMGWQVSDLTFGNDGSTVQGFGSVPYSV